MKFSEQKLSVLWGCIWPFIAKSDICFMHYETWGERKIKGTFEWSGHPETYNRGLQKSDTDCFYACQNSDNAPLY